MERRDGGAHWIHREREGELMRGRRNSWLFVLLSVLLLAAGLAASSGVDGRAALATGDDLYSENFATSLVRQVVQPLIERNAVGASVLAIPPTGTVAGLAQAPPADASVVGEALVADPAHLASTRETVDSPAGDSTEESGGTGSSRDETPAGVAEPLVAPVPTLNAPVTSEPTEARDASIGLLSSGDVYHFPTTTVPSDHFPTTTVPTEFFPTTTVPTDFFPTTTVPTDAYTSPPSSIEAQETTTTSTSSTTSTTTTPTTAAPVVEPDPTEFGNAARYHGGIDVSSTFDFGQSRSLVEQAISDQFGDLDYVGGTIEDVSIVDDPSGDYLLTRSGVGNDSRKQWNVLLPEAQESYLVYRFLLEPGFDAGDGDGSEGSPAALTGVKLPGLMRGDPGDNTGGNHVAGGFSGRLMIRGTESSGSTSAPRDGLTLSAYIYGQEIDDQSISSAFGRDYFFLDGFDSTPFRGIEPGTFEGVGDPRIFDLEEGEWVTLVLGYRVDGDNGWFKAWASTGEGPLTERLFVPNINWTGGDGTAGADSILFQQFWGGSGSVWYPDEVSYTRFKDFAVFTNEADALNAAR